MAGIRKEIAVVCFLLRARDLGTEEEDGDVGWRGCQAGPACQREREKKKRRGVGLAVLGRCGASWAGFAGWPR